jgi:Ca2+-binding RTX toxin-like protein
VNINGTNKADHIVGTIGNDVISGGRGGDWLEGGKGDDVLTGDSNPLHDDGRDTFVLRAGDGNDRVTDYQAGEDSLMFDSGTGYYDGLLAFGATSNGYLSDGLTFTNSAGTATWEVHAVGDSTEIDMIVGGVNVGSLTLEHVAPTDVLGSDIFGG